MQKAIDVLYTQKARDKRKGEKGYDLNYTVDGILNNPFNIKENNVYCDKIFFNNKIIKDFLLNK